MSLLRALGLATAGVILAVGSAQAGTTSDVSAPGAPTAGQASEPAKAPEPSTLILSIRAHALGLVQESPLPQDTRPPGLERMRAPTGEGTSRMPSATTELARGVYLTVMPGCIPGVDEPAIPYRPRRR